MDFFSYSSGTCGAICLFIVCLLTALTQLLPSIWLAKWLSEEENEESEDMINPAIFGSLIAVFLLFSLMRSLTIFQIILKGATNLHDAVTKSVLRANILFFDENPIGRIMTRFSRDLMVFDLVVPIISIITVQGFFRTATVIIMVVIINPWMLVVTLFCGILMFITMRRGSRVMIESQKRDAESRGPI